MPGALRKNADLIVLPVHEQQVIEINARAMDVGRAAAGGGTNGERIGRGHLVEVVEKRGVTIGGLVIERCDERAIDELAIVLLSHVGAVHVVVDAVFAPGDQAHLIRQSDHASRRQILVFMTGITTRVDKRSEPVAHRERTRISWVPGEVHDAFSQLIDGKLWIVGTIAGHHIDVSVLVDSGRRICHPYAPTPSGTIIVRWSAAPDVCLGDILRQLASVVRHHPTWSSSSLAATECDHQRLRATRLGGQCQGRSLYLKITIEATTVYVKAVDQHRIELLLG